MSGPRRALLLLALLAGLPPSVVAIATLHARSTPLTQTAPQVAPFVETQVLTEYVNPIGKTVNGRLTLLKHKATGACWIVYPGSSFAGVAPAPREVCGP